MPIEADRVETVTFDSFTTIVDVRATTTRELGRYVDDPETVADVASLWRFRAVEYRMLCNYLDTYEDYLETTRDALEFALASNGVDLAGDEVDDLVGAFHELDVFEDVRENFRRLHDRGYDLYIVSNGTQDLLASMVEAADIAEFVAGTISADDVETYKPDVAFYEHAVEQTGTPAGELVHVATPWYDIYGANNAGMGTVWVNREERPWETFDGGPDETITTLGALPPLFE